MPLIPQCHPVLCHEAGAVAKKLSELAMNCPYGCHCKPSKAVAPNRTTLVAAHRVSTNSAVTVGHSQW